MTESERTRTRRLTKHEARRTRESGAPREIDSVEKPMRGSFGCVFFFFHHLKKKYSQSFRAILMVYIKFIVYCVCYLPRIAI